MNTTNSIDNLLSMLNETTEQCNELIVLSESSSPYLEKIQSRIYGMQNSLLSSLKSSTPNYLRQDTIDLIEKVSKIQITEAYKVMTYPNIHNEKKYDIKAGVMIGYVLNKIDRSLQDDNIEFDPVKINREAIAYAFKKLTGQNIGSELAIDDFRKEYRNYALGGDRRTLIYPRVSILTALALKSPHTIKYIDDRLIYKHIRSLKNYVNELNHRFEDLVKKDPKLKNKLNKYIDCVESAIKNTLRMYKDIRFVLVELDVEYRRIFREILSIDSELKESINESAYTMNDIVPNLKSVYSQVSKLDNMVMNESIENILKQESKESLLKSLKESLINTNNYFIQTCIGIQEKREDTRNRIMNDAGLVSKISQDMCNSCQVKSYAGVNRILQNDINNCTLQYLHDKEKDINEYPQGTELVSSIIKNIDIFKNINISNNITGTKWFPKVIIDIQYSIFGDYGYTTLNVESLANNLIKIPKILENLNSTMIKIYYDISTKIDKITDRIKNGDYNIKNDIINIVNYYCIYNEILNCIYRKIELIGIESIISIKKVLKLNEVI